MGDLLREKLTWFLKNLDLLLEDFALEDQAISVDLYFDTRDITHAVLGLERFYYAGAYDVKDSFQAPRDRPLRDRTLVLCLAFSGRLGTVRMLPPHQAEFLAGLNRDFGIHEKLPPKQMVRQFLEAVSETDSIKQEASILREADEETTLEYVRAHAGSAANFFKIIQLIRGITWRERFVTLRQTGTLELKSHELDYKEIVDSNEFKVLYKTLGGLRKRKSHANFADAVALTILGGQVKKMETGERNAVPRFYVSSESADVKPLFLTVIEKADLASLFSYGDSNRKSVLRESDYFIFKSIFETPNASNDGAARKRRLSDQAELVELREDVFSILKSSSYIRPEQLSDISFAGKNITQVIDDLNTFLFFTNVWLPSSRQEIDLAVQDLTEAADELKSERFTQTVGQGIAEAKAVIEQNVAQYQLIRQMWEEIEIATRSLQADLTVPEDIDYSRDFGLLRFSFPDTAYERINQVLEDLLSGTKEEGRLTHSNVITACYMAHILPEKRYVNDVAAAAAVLWVAERYRELIKLLSQINPLPHYSLQLIFAAAMFETQEEEIRGKEILKELNERYQNAESEERSNLAVGLAYLYFHYWRLRGHNPSWDRDQNEITAERTRNDKDLISTSIKLALEAYTSLGEKDMRKKVYSLNQYLYYMVMADDPSLAAELHRVADILLWYKEQGDLDWWQHRFDDTLARYYYSLVASAENEEAEDFYISKAIEYSDYAFRRAPWDRVSRTFKDRLQNRKGRNARKLPMSPSPTELQN